MIRLLAIAFAFLAQIALAPLALALEPSEMLADAELEARARHLDHEIRCVQCQSESLASSNAAWARDARRVIREQVSAGRTDSQIKTFFVERYGDFVLMDPPKSGATWMLWLAGPVLAVLAFGIGAGFVRRSARLTTQQTAGLDADEQARLQRILSKHQ